METITWVGFGVLSEALAVFLLIPLAIVFFLVEAILLTRFAHHIISPKHRYDDLYEDRPIGSFVVAAIVLFGGLYLLGIFNVVLWVAMNLLTFGYIVGGFLLAGFAYMCVKGIVKLVKARYEKDAALEEAYNEYMEENPEATPEDVEKFISEHEAAQKIEVAKHKGSMTAWVFLWPLDLLYVCVFQFIDRLQDLWNVVWASLKGVFQNVADRIIGDPAQRLLKRHAVGSAPEEEVNVEATATVAAKPEEVVSTGEENDKS